MSTTWVPPGGAASMAQQTPAAKASMGMLRQVRTRSQRKGTKAAKRYARNKRRIKGAKSKGPAKRRTTKSGQKLKFGSPAWRKKYMKR